MGILELCTSANCFIKLTNWLIQYINFNNITLGEDVA